jgi:serine phosphatase RsbU (regulator of sigma subunit)
LLGIIICLIPANSGLVYQSNLHKSLLFFLPGTASGVGISFLFASVYFLRLFFAVVVSLPTSGIVERRTTEISSLTYLNKLIAETINYENLLQTVTDLAMNSIGGIAAWTELYLNERTRPEQTNSPGTLSLPINGLSYSSPLKWLKPGSIQTIIGTKNIEAPLIEKLDEKYKLREYLRIMDKPLLVDSIIEHPPIIEQNRRDRKSEQSVIEFKIQDLNWNLIPGARALIAVPLYSRDERIGTLVVVSDTEYGYETDDVKVLTAFSDNVSVAFENARLFQDSVEKERYRRELMLAREIEEKLLPQALPDIPGYSLSAFSVPAEEVGGDYYDVVKLKTGKTCILIGDVSGKGIAAAFLMAQLKGVVLAVAPESTGAVDILRRINNTLYGSIDKQMYITLCSLVIDNANINETDASGTDVSGRISIARAGHMPIISKQSNITKLITPKGIGIGLAEASIFGENIEEIELELERGDICLLFTDGVNELKNERYEEFGINSLKQILNMSVPMNIGTDASRTNVNVDYLLSEIKLRLKIFAGADAYGNVFQHDDMTIVALGYNGINH